MQFKGPKDDAKYEWTAHVGDKMRFYGISESLIKRIIRFPKRVEEGIAPQTVAAMQPTSNKKKPQEIWVMYRTAGKPRIVAGVRLPPRKRIISAWRYPGVSSKDRPVIPADVLQDLLNEV